MLLQISATAMRFEVSINFYIAKMSRVNLRKECIDSSDNRQVLKLVSTMFHHITHSLSIVIQLQYIQHTSQLIRHSRTADFTLSHCWPLANLLSGMTSQDVPFSKVELHKTNQDPLVKAWTDQNDSKLHSHWRLPQMVAHQKWLN